MMATNCSFSGSTASGASSWNSTCSGSSLRTAATPLSWKARCEGAIMARSSENTTSSAVKGVPSWKLTSGRSLKRQRVGAVICQETASAGSSWNFSLRPTSDS